MRSIRFFERDGKVKTHHITGRLFNIESEHLHRYLEEFDLCTAIGLRWKSTAPNQPGPTTPGVTAKRLSNN
jgi:hypothetical protein